jgi:import receptor subunit TOM20
MNQTTIFGTREPAGNGTNDFHAAYAAYFDHKRRTDPGFRKALKRESRRQAKLAKEEAEIHEKQQEDDIKQAVEEALEEGFPRDLEEREAFFMQQIANGEGLAGDGGHHSTVMGDICADNLAGSDPIAAALCFYKGLKVYPEPKALIGIYENTVPENVLKLLAQMVAQDKDLKVGSFGTSAPGSDSGEAIE